MDTADGEEFSIFCVAKWKEHDNRNDGMFIENAMNENQISRMESKLLYLMFTCDIHVCFSC